MVDEEKDAGASVVLCREQSRSNESERVSVVPGLGLVIGKAANENDGRVISLSSRQCRDVDRWETTMPSLNEHAKDLQVLDLYKNRYIRQLDDSVVDLVALKSLLLVGCSRLQKLPDSIGRLQQLEEVGLSFFAPAFRI